VAGSDQDDSMSYSSEGSKRRQPSLLSLPPVQHAQRGCHGGGAAELPAAGWLFSIDERGSCWVGEYGGSGGPR
jgi:hypothetical protein